MQIEKMITLTGVAVSWRNCAWGHRAACHRRPQTTHPPAQFQRHQLLMCAWSVLGLKRAVGAALCLSESLWSPNQRHGRSLLCRWQMAHSL